MTKVLNEMIYEGFETTSAEAIEILLGGHFESHLPSTDQILVRGQDGMFTINKGDRVVLVVEAQ